MTLVHTVLLKTLGRHFGLGKSRLVTLAVLIAGLVQSRTVNLSHLAVHLPGPARPASKYRRLQRFFQFVPLDQEVAARLVVRMLDLSRPKYLALDRTNWKLGSRDINILVLAIVTLEDGHTWSLATLLRRTRARQGKVICQGRINGTPGSTRQPVHLAAKRLRDGEWLIVATNRSDPNQALNDYRKRWGIECLFGDAKTRGLNIEDTHITNPEKLASLIGIVMLAITWAYRCATTVMGMKAIPRKSHGRREKSWFRIGLDALRDWIANQPTKAAHAWAQNAPRTSLSHPKHP